MRFMALCHGDQSLHRPYGDCLLRSTHTHRTLAAYNTLQSNSPLRHLRPSLARVSAGGNDVPAMAVAGCLHWSWPVFPPWPVAGDLGSGIVGALSQLPPPRNTYTSLWRELLVLYIQTHSLPKPNSLTNTIRDRYPTRRDTSATYLIPSNMLQMPYIRDQYTPIHYISRRLLLSLLLARRFSRAFSRRLWRRRRPQRRPRRHHEARLAQDDRGGRRRRLLVERGAV